METRTTINGTKWLIAPSYMGGYALMINNFGKEGFHYSGYSFKTKEEVNVYLDEVDARVKNAAHFTPCTIPDNYYGVRGRYYGD